MSILYSNITYIVLFIIMLAIVAISYGYIFYYNHILEKRETVTTIRRALFWGLIGLAIISLIIFIIYVSFRIFRPLATVAAATMIAGTVPIVSGTSDMAPVVSTMPTVPVMVTNMPDQTTFTSQEIDSVRKDIIALYTKLSESDKLKIKPRILKANTLYKNLRSINPNKLPKSLYDMYMNIYYKLL